MLKQSVSPRFKERRTELMKKDSSACFLFFGAEELVRNHSVHYPFRQHSTFHYLTGYDEPGAILVLVNGESHLFVQDRNEEDEIWDGERYGVDRAAGIFSVDYAHSIRHFTKRFSELIKGANRLYYHLNNPENPRAYQRDQIVMKVVSESSVFRGKGSLGNLPLLDPTPLITELRIIKDADEVQLIRNACSISAQAHRHLLKVARPGMLESELETEFQHFVRQRGLLQMGYSPIVAGGANATTLHYVRNNEFLKDGELVLIDAGAENELYTADITQTFPVGKVFFQAQKNVYQKVLEVNREIIRLTKPGISYRSLHQEAVNLLSEGLKSLGVSLPDQDSYRRYFPHGLGHYLGLDVHDLGIYHEQGKDFILQPGMLMTNEPGLYFRGTETEYQGIGVRIEDDLLITQNGCENLTHELPRTIEEIEALRS
jgi:Xaa-Pro aminopeptidase